MPPSDTGPHNQAFLEACDRILAGTHDDPFSFLGPHDRGLGLSVTVFDPGAQKMSVRFEDGRISKLSPVDGFAGLFDGQADGNGAYSLIGQVADGATWEMQDPYRFGPVIGEIDEHLLAEGTHDRLWQVLGAHTMRHEGVKGTHFAVWAPNAKRVSVVGDFNTWDGRRNPMRRRGPTGVWEIFLPDVFEGAAYKFEILGTNAIVQPLKADPVGFGSQHAPDNASVVRDISGYGWHDSDWMQKRAEKNSRSAPISIYEVHLGSWRRRLDEDGRALSYRELSEDLIGYVASMGFTHIELLPVSEYPFDGSWGYQPVGLFAPTVRFGPPHEFRDLVDAAHKKGLGVLLDWVPGHFPTDDHGLGRFDGTPLYEHADPKEGFHQDWNTYIFNYGRSEVCNYLVSNALYWLEEYHIDGLRVDAVASMLYRDYSRADGEWVPNKDGGRENYEAINMLQRMNASVYDKVDGIMTVAEESTSFPGVSQPVDSGGLGFGYKWNMGWMNDTLAYIQKDPVHRRHHHAQMTFGIHYAFSENFILPISHDEVVHGKGSMIEKMPGNEWEAFANLRAYYGFMWGHPGKKLLFMGQEFAQKSEWSHDGELDWVCLENPKHSGMRHLVGDLNRLYREERSLHERDCTADGFQWIDAGNADESVFVWLRQGDKGSRPILVVCNFTPVERSSWRCGVPKNGHWEELLNTDATDYGGENRGNLGGINASEMSWHGQPYSIEITLPPLSVVFLAPVEFEET